MSVSCAANNQARFIAFASENWLTIAVGEYQPGKGWVATRESFTAPPPDQVYSLFGNTGKLGEVLGKSERAADSHWIPIEWHARIDRGQTMQQPFALAIAGSWPQDPIPKKELPLDDPTAMHVVSDFLKRHGIKVETPFLTQVYQVDLNGDGQDETLICAHSDDKSLRDDQAAAIYALALVHAGSAEKGKTIKLAGQYSYKPAHQSIEDHLHEYGTRDFYRFIAITDIDGDGHEEVALYRAKDDATQIDLFTFKKLRRQKVLSAYKANYN